MNPDITVIIPCYNQAHYLTNAVNSVLGQTFSNWECIIINDGATDDTEKIALQLIEKDARIKYIKKQNGGLSSARNKGLDEAKGNYIQFLDADDSIDKNKFSASLLAPGNADVIITGFISFSNDTAFINPSFHLNENLFNFQSILQGWDDEFIFPPHSGIYKSHFFKTLRFDESLRAREDWLMWLQIYRKNPKTFFIDKPYALYRYSPASMSQDKSLMNKSLLQVFKLIYPLLHENEKELFFNKVINSCGNLLNESATLVTLTRASKSFRIGNFFIRRIKKLRSLFK